MSPAAVSPAAASPAGSVGAAGSVTVSGAAARRRGAAVDDAPLIPERSADDSDAGWHETSDSNDDRLRQDVPPHW